MIISLAEAAKLVGKSRQTIYRYAGNGKLSTTRMDDGSKGVDTSELQRVFGTIKTPVTDETVSLQSQSDSLRQGDTGHDTALKAELDAAKNTIRTQEERITELKADKELFMRLLEDKTDQNAAQPSPSKGLEVWSHLWPPAIALTLIALIAIAMISGPQKDTPIKEAEMAITTHEEARAALERVSAAAKGKTAVSTTEEPKE